MVSKSIAIRCDAGPDIGTGHVVRCLSLAAALKQEKCDISLIVSAETLVTMPVLQESGFDIHTDIDGAYPCDVLIVDHYGLDEIYERGARTWAQTIVVIDDLANRKHDCDVLLDQTYGRAEADYKALVPVGCRILTGADYALLRPEFATLRGKALEKRRNVQAVKTVLIFLSGTDRDNVTLTALKGVQGVDGIAHIDIVMGENSPHLESVRAVMGNHVTLHTGLDAAEIAALMLRADISVGAGGTTSWERCTLGLPTILIEIAGNQKKIAAGLSEAGVVLNLGWYVGIEPQDVTRALKDMRDRLQPMAQAASRICDGQGVRKAVVEIFEKSLVYLRKMAEQDRDLVFKWQNIPGTREFSRNTQPPQYEDHCVWFEKALMDCARYNFIVEYEGKPAGLLRFDSKGRDVYEVSILLDPQFYGRGIAKEALKVAESRFKGCVFEAEILPLNRVSQNLFKKCGYVHRIGNWYERKIG